MRLTYLLMLAPGLALAEAPRLVLPVDCPDEMHCYIQNLVDHDVTPEARDFRCGPMVYDGHKGTDFALPSLAAQRSGVDVLAAAAGRVTGVRDGMIDQLQGTPGAPAVADRECGNGVVIDHGDGWETQYCHLARGTVAVQTGQEVAAGERIGQIGLSGQTEFPHLHLSLRREGEVVDPFAPEDPLTCDPDAATDHLWAEDIALPAGGIIATGFASAVPDFDAVTAGTAAETEIATSAGALVGWAFLHGGRAGDLLQVEIVGPAGAILTDTQRLEKTQARLFRAMGRKTPPEGWAEGDYTATFTLLRGGDVLDMQSTAITLSP